MQRLLERLRWQNLNIQIKTGLMFGSQLLLIAVMALASLLSLNTVRNRVDDVTANVVETRTLTRDILTNIEEIGLLQNRLVQESQRPGFDPTTSLIPGQIRENIRVIQEEQLVRLDELIEMVEASGQGASALQDTELGSINELQNELLELDQQIAEANREFDTILSLINELHHPETGTMTLIDNYGSELEEIVFAHNDNTLAAQLNLMRNIESSIPSTGNEGYIGLKNASATLSGSYDQRIPFNEQSNDFPGLLALYVLDAQDAANKVEQLSQANESFEEAIRLMLSSSSEASKLADEVVSTQFTALQQVQDTARAVVIAGLVIVLIVGGGLTYLFGRDVSQRVNVLLNTTQEYESGNLEPRAVLDGADEFSQLAGSFNAMAMQLQSLVGGLEQRVAERTRDLTITAEIGQAVVALRDPRTLMTEVVELVRQRFGFYHAQVFLIDDAGERAELVASTGTAGRELLARRHSLEVGSLSVIGQVTSTGEAVIASDTSESYVHKRNELLPDTRSEMALPMRIGDRIIGALDVQSVAPNAFDTDAIAVFQTMADQLAIALENARLYNDLEYTKGLLQVIERRVTTESWDAYRQERADSSLSFVMDGGDIQAVEAAQHPILAQAIRRGQMVAVEIDNDEEISLAVPIRVRGEVIGAFGFTGDDLHDLSSEDFSLIEAVVDRVGLALENLRLVEQTTRRAEYEELVNDITSKIVGSTDVSHILQTTVKELGRVLRAPQTSVQLRSSVGDDEL